jgi:hypothetical protein
MQDSHSVITGAGKRKYHFDAKKTVRDEYFMKITMEESSYDGMKRSTIVVFEEDLAAFKTGLKEMFGFMNYKKTGAEEAGEKTETV